MGLSPTMRRVEREQGRPLAEVLRELAESGTGQTEAAKGLGIARSALCRWLQHYGIDWRQSRGWRTVRQVEAEWGRPISEILRGMTAVPQREAAAMLGIEQSVLCNHARKHGIRWQADKTRRISSSRRWDRDAI